MCQDGANNIIDPVWLGDRPEWIGCPEGVPKGKNIVPGVSIRFFHLRAVWVDRGVLPVGGSPGGRCFVVPIGIGEYNRRKVSSVERGVKNFFLCLVWIRDRDFRQLLFPKVTGRLFGVFKIPCRYFLQGRKSPLLVGGRNTNF